MRALFKKRQNVVLSWSMTKQPSLWLYWIISKLKALDFMSN